MVGSPFGFVRTWSRYLLDSRGFGHTEFKPTSKLTGHLEIFSDYGPKMTVLKTKLLKNPYRTRSSLILEVSTEITPWLNLLVTGFMYRRVNSVGRVIHRRQIMGQRSLTSGFSTSMERIPVCRIIHLFI